MINNQNLAVLSEKVAYLESAVTNSNEASEISYDNTDSGLTADDVQAAIDELNSAKANKSQLVECQLNYSSESEKFEYVVATTPRPHTGIQIVCPARNRQTGAIYALWFNSGADAWVIGATLSGSAPSNGDSLHIQYLV